MSFSKKAIYAVNGFDEDYTLLAFVEDIDLSWRFTEAEYQHFSLHNITVVYHLDHPASWINQDENLTKHREKRNWNEFVCKNGLLKL